MAVETEQDIPEIPALRRRKSDFRKREANPRLSIVRASSSEDAEADSIVRAQERVIAGDAPEQLRSDLSQAQALLTRVWAAYAKGYLAKQVLDEHAEACLIRHLNASASEGAGEIEQARVEMEEAVSSATLARENLSKIRFHVESASREVTRLGVLVAIADGCDGAILAEDFKHADGLQLLI